MPVKKCFLVVICMIFTVSLGASVSSAEEVGPLVFEASTSGAPVHAIQVILAGLADAPWATLMAHKSFLIQFVIGFYLVTVLLVSPYLYALFLFLLLLAPRVLWNLSFLSFVPFLGCKRVRAIQVRCEQCFPTLPDFSERIVAYSRAEAFAHGRDASFRGRSAAGSW
ncbi:MAG: hypothetical protein ACTSXQ_01015 [Alphaproteobacteria bacterium]